MDELRDLLQALPGTSAFTIYIHDRSDKFKFSTREGAEFLNHPVNVLVIASKEL